jgi:hypothetical protein
MAAQQWGILGRLGTVGNINLLAGVKIHGAKYSGGAATV